MIAGREKAQRGSYNKYEQIHNFDRSDNSDQEKLDQAPIPRACNFEVSFHYNCNHHGRTSEDEAENIASEESFACICIVNVCFIRFKKGRVIAPLYTGGPVAVTPDGNRLVTCVGEEAVLTEVQEGKEICRFAGVRSASLHSITLFSSRLLRTPSPLQQCAFPRPLPTSFYSPPR